MIYLQVNFKQNYEKMHFDYQFFVKLEADKLFYIDFYNKTSNCTLIIFRENDTWQCLLCMNFADIPDNVLGEKRDGEMSLKEKKIAERIVLELYCQYEPSLPFREVIGPDV